jgi:hypothetical protein
LLYPGGGLGAGVGAAQLPNPLFLISKIRDFLLYSLKKRTTVFYLRKKNKSFLEYYYFKINNTNKDSTKILVRLF